MGMVQVQGRRECPGGSGGQGILDWADSTLEWEVGKSLWKQERGSLERAEMEAPAGPIPVQYREDTMPVDNTLLAPKEKDSCAMDMGRAERICKES